MHERYKGTSFISQWEMKQLYLLNCFINCLCLSVICLHFSGVYVLDYTAVASSKVEGSCFLSFGSKWCEWSSSPYDRLTFEFDTRLGGRHTVGLEVALLPEGACSLLSSTSLSVSLSWLSCHWIQTISITAFHLSHSLYIRHHTILFGAVDIFNSVKFPHFDIFQNCIKRRWLFSGLLRRVVR
jgi:hypothetical protein